MLRKSGIAFTAVTISLFLSAPVLAQNPSVENGQGQARHWTNLASFANACIEKKLLDKTHGKYARFGSYLGGFLIGALHRDPAAVTAVLTPFLVEGAQGRVHEFNEKGEFMAYDIEFTPENCAGLGGALKTAFDQFSKVVLEE